MPSAGSADSRQLLQTLNDAGDTAPEFLTAVVGGGEAVAGAGVGTADVGLDKLAHEGYNLGHDLGNLAESSGSSGGSSTGSVTRNALSDEGYSQAQRIIDQLGGNFEGQATPNMAGIDGYYDGIPASLKEIQPDSANPTKALANTVTNAQNSASKAGYSRVALCACTRIDDVGCLGIALDSGSNVRRRHHESFCRNRQWLLPFRIGVGMAIEWSLYDSAEVSQLRLVQAADVMAGRMFGDGVLDFTEAVDNAIQGRCAGSYSSQIYVTCDGLPGLVEIESGPAVEDDGSVDSGPLVLARVQARRTLLSAALGLVVALAWLEQGGGELSGSGIGGPFACRDLNELIVKYSSKGYEKKKNVARLARLIVGHADMGFSLLAEPI